MTNTRAKRHGQRSVSLNGRMKTDGWRRLHYLTCWRGGQQNC